MQATELNNEKRYITYHNRGDYYLGGGFAKSVLFANLKCYPFVSDREQHLGFQSDWRTKIDFTLC